MEKLAIEASIVKLQTFAISKTKSNVLPIAIMGRIGKPMRSQRNKNGGGPARVAGPPPLGEKLVEG
jgi:hypothetical protein